MKRYLTASIWTGLTIIGSLAWAQPPEYTDKETPMVLRDWVPWVKAGIPNYACYHIDCVWPASVALDLNDRGGTFTQRIDLLDEQSVRLPGGDGTWPLDVTANNAPVVVTDIDGRPTTTLPAGRFTVTGRFLWQQMPEQLKIPPHTAIVSLTANGVVADSVRRDPADTIWIRGRAVHTQKRDHIFIETHRKLTDGVPLTLHTHITLRISGKPRELSLTNVVVEDARVIDIDADLPTQLTEDNTLVVQSRTGTFVIDITSVIPHDVSSLKTPRTTAPWPEQEIWVFDPDEQLRHVSLSGASNIDPQRTTLPPKWKSLGAYVMTPDSTLTITTTRKGQETPPPDTINLSRDMWLDMDGDGLTIRDTLTGTMQQKTRLNYGTDAVLGHVMEKDAPRVITSDPQSTHFGVELRETPLHLTAVLRRDKRPSSMDAVGWETDVNELDARLHLPPGWQLFTASGVDSVIGTWWAKWHLFEFFFVLIVSVAVTRLINWQSGLLAFLTTVALHAESGIDNLVAICIFLLPVLGLLTVLPTGKLRRLMIASFFLLGISLTAVVVPFTVDQARRGLYPQLTYPHRSLSTIDYTSLDAPRDSQAPHLTEDQEAAPSPTQAGIQEESADHAEPAGIVTQQAISDTQRISPPSPPPPAADMKRRKGPLRSAYKTKASLASTGVRYPRHHLADKSEAMEVVQTGPGIPNWRWNTYRLKWHGPVDAHHEIKLYLMSPVVTLVLSVLRILLLGGLSVVLLLFGIRSIRPRSPDASPPPTSRAPTAAAGAVVVVAGLLISSTANAQIPSTELLTELRRRLTPQSDCNDNCTTTEQVEVAVDDTQVTLRCTVHAREKGPWKLPGPLTNFVPETITENGKDAIFRSDDSHYISILLPVGIHRIEARGQFVSRDTPVIEFATQPHRVWVEGDHYTADGIDEYGHVNGQLHLIPKQTDDARPADDTPKHNVAPWLQVDRQVNFFLPWQVITDVTRKSTADESLQVKIPLLTGESVTTDGIRIDGDAAVVSMARGQQRVQWISELKETDRLVLRAPTDRPWTENWHIRCGHLWDCRFSGAIPTQNVIGARQYKPWPGEKVTVTLRRPAPISGQHTTIDEVQITVNPGLRITSSRATLKIRTSQGGTKSITLPENATVKKLLINGEDHAFKQRDRILDVPLTPGKNQVHIAWNQHMGLTTLFTTPTLELDGRATNVHLTVNIPDNRWLIWASGPQMGPAVLFWGYLLTIVLLAFFILARTRLSPLKGWQWALLFLGLTQIPIEAAVMVGLWFFAMAWRATDPLKNNRRSLYNLLQVGLAIWTITAFSSIIGAVVEGLAVQPDMQVQGLGSHNGQLNWYADAVFRRTPTATVLSLPILAWKTIMLLWSLWLAYSLVAWSKWAFTAFSTGRLWFKKPPKQ